MREPTHDECKAHARIALDDGKTGVACWYPQMGGYTAHAVIVLDAGCVDVYVWHDGLFPFGGTNSLRWNCTTATEVSSSSSAC